jgi:hypothetical protein
MPNHKRLCSLSATFCEICKKSFANLKSFRVHLDRKTHQRLVRGRNAVPQVVVTLAPGLGSGMLYGVRGALPDDLGLFRQEQPAVQPALAIAHDDFGGGEFGGGFGDLNEDFNVFHASAGANLAVGDGIARDDSVVGDLTDDAVRAVGADLAGDVCNGDQAAGDGAAGEDDDDDDPILFHSFSDGAAQPQLGKSSSLSSFRLGSFTAPKPLAPAFASPSTARPPAIAAPPPPPPPPPPSLHRGMAVQPLITTSLASVFAARVQGASGQNGGLMVVVSKPAFQAKFWTQHGTNTHRVTADRAHLRALAGIAVLASWIAVVPPSELQPVRCDVQHLVASTDVQIGTHIVAALLSSCGRSAPPSNFFAVGRRGSVADLLARFGMTKTSMHTGLNMVRAIFGWFLLCAQMCTRDETFQMPATYDKIAAFCGEAVTATEELSPQVTKFQVSIHRRARQRGRELLSFGTEVYVQQLLGMYGACLRCLVAESVELRRLFRDTPAHIDLAQEHVERMWHVIAIVLMGIGGPAARKGLLRTRFDGAPHRFLFAASAAAFDGADSRSAAKSGVFRLTVADDSFALIVSPHAGQKGAQLEAPLLLPSTAQSVFNNLFGGLRGQHVLAAPQQLRIDDALEGFRSRNHIIVPTYLNLGDIADDAFDLRRSSRAVRVQTVAIGAARAVALAALADGGGDDESASDALDDIGDIIDQAPIATETIRLSQLVVRRALTTLLHDLYMRHLVDALDLCAATFVNLHAPSEAYKTYNKLHIMFRDYDVPGASRRSTRWSVVERQFSTMLNAAHAGGRARSLNTDVLPWAALNDRVLAVHETLRRQASFEDPSGERLCPECSDRLAARTDWRFHKCFVQRQHVIKRFVARAEDE